MGRPERALDPSAGPLETFGHDLRELRRAAGNPAYRPLARRAGYSASALSAAASGRAFPSLAVTLAYVGACGGDTAAWERRWQRTAAELSARPVAPTPRELPLDVYGFTGRSTELDRLDELLHTAGRGASAVVVSAVSGTGGVGKTALAVHWAHRAADRFPDGHLYVDLRGYDPDRPLEPGDVLAAFLRALGVPGADVPPEPAERAARFRTLVAGRRMLVLLDNAHSADQVRPLLPGTPGCFVVITSRDSLAGLVARDGAQRLDLDLLPEPEAVTLLRTLIGPRVDAEPAAALALVRRCARLPLALRLAAELAVARPSTGLAALVAELAGERERLDLLDAPADRRAAVRSVFGWSYRQLPEPATRAFRLLGLHPGRDADPYALAALAGCDLAEARRLVDTLVRAHLLEPGGRLRMHDLLRAYAAERAARDPEPDRRAAMVRLLDHYLATCADAMDAVHPAERHRRPRVPRPGTPLPALTDPVDAHAWLDAERANLVAAVAYAAGHGLAAHADRLTATMAHHLESGGHYAEAMTAYRHVLRAARERGDPRAEADARHRVGTLYCLLGRPAEAVDHLQRALELRRTVGDAVMVGRTHNNLGNIFQRLGRLAEAAGHVEQALASQQAAGDRAGEAVVRTNLGNLYVASGRYRDALLQYEQAIALSREVGERAAEGTTLAASAVVLARLGRPVDAIDRYLRALVLLRESGDRIREILTLTHLGVAYLDAGHPDRAVEHTERALAMAEAVGDRMATVDALNNLGQVYRRVGHAPAALEQHRRALAMARESGYRSREIGAMNGLGEASAALGRTDDAVRHHAAARDLATDLGDRDQRARALRGLARGSADPEPLWREARALYAELDVPERALVGP